MPQTARETMDQALFAFLVSKYAWATSSRRWVPWTKVPANMQPALFVLSQGEQVDYRGVGMPRSYTRRYMAVVYVNTTNDPAAIPSSALNPILDLLDASIPSGPSDNWVVTLGLSGITEVRIRGEIKTDEGALGAQGFALVPIEIVTT